MPVKQQKKKKNPQLTVSVPASAGIQSRDARVAVRGRRDRPADPESGPAPDAAQQLELRQRGHRLGLVLARAQGLPRLGPRPGHAGLPPAEALRHDQRHAEPARDEHAPAHTHAPHLLPAGKCSQSGDYRLFFAPRAPV